MSEVDDILDEVAGAKPHQAFSRNYVKAGDHVLELKEFVYKKTRGGKKMFAAQFVVVSSSVHKSGELVGNTWKMSHHTDEWQLEQDKGRVNAFVTALLGPAFLGASPTKTQISEAIKMLIATTQKGRGIRVKATGHKQGETFVDVAYENIPGQTADTIKANRARQDAGAPPAGSGTPVAGAGETVAKSEKTEETKKTEPETKKEESALGSLLGGL
jgi:ribosomal protein L12E/L44/L45/RPP1/RPP2